MTPMSKKTQGNRRLTSSADRSTVSRMTGQNATPQLITEDELLAWYDENDRRSRKRLNALRVNYALEPEDVWALIKKQKGYCPICATPLYLEAGYGVGIAIDHEGESGQGHVRGVLHARCNSLLGLLEELYGDPDCDHKKNIAHGYLTKPPAKKIKVGDSNLYDDTIEDRWKRGRTGRICENPNCKKEILAAARLGKKYCDVECKRAAYEAASRAKRLENLPDRECLKCGDPIDDDVHLLQKYCDLECREEARNDRRRDAYNERRRKNN